MTQKIDGILFENMIKNGLATLCQSETYINDLNVFPVADGDTGSNMHLTLQNGILSISNEQNVGEYTKLLAGGMLLGARGNSGVILSQIFKGISLALEGAAEIGAVELKNALTLGYKTAYDAVVSPVEGTILTVSREGIENVSLAVTAETDIEELLKEYLVEMRSSLEKTPELLQVLKEYGVVDSGAVGFITIVEGMYKFLLGEVVTGEETSINAPKVNISSEVFNEDSSFVEGYCMEFILQLMNSASYSHDFLIDEYIESLKDCGNSLVATKEGSRVKVHIHTMKPAVIIELSQKFGEFVTFKLENMQIQHNEFIAKHKKARPHSELAVVAVVNGEGMKQIYEDFGCVEVIESTGKMNISTKEFLAAYKEANADIVVVLPNNSNNIPSAELARDMLEGVDVRIIPTDSMLEGYYALSMDIPDDTVEKRIKAMYEGAANVATIAETTASKDFENELTSCKEGEEIAIINGEVSCSGEDAFSVILEALGKLPEISDKEFCVLFRGESVDEALEEELQELIEESYPLLELQFMDGGQSIYHWLLGLI